MSLTSPGTKDADRDDDLIPKVLGDDRKYRSIVATINYLATDMPDLQFACKEACREMSAPTEGKGIGWYILRRDKVVWMFPWKDGCGSLKVFTDSDRARDLETRKSISGGVVTMGEHCLKTWSTNQTKVHLRGVHAKPNITLLLTERRERLECRRQQGSLALRSGTYLSVELATDSGGAKSFASRRGSGCIRHIEVEWLWLQQAVADGRFRMTKVWQAPRIQRTF